MSAAELLAGNLAFAIGAGGAFTALHVALEVLPRASEPLPATAKRVARTPHL